MKKVLIGMLIIIIGIGVYVFSYSKPAPEVPRQVGGDRDAHGCLGPAGYTWSAEVGVCLRTFEMTPDIMKAAALAVDYTGQSYGLTVSAFNSYEEFGAYDITLSDANQLQRTIYIRHGKVDPSFKPQ